MRRQCFSHMVEIQSSMRPYRKAMMINSAAFAEDLLSQTTQSSKKVISSKERHSATVTVWGNMQACMSVYECV